jgi:hypothetical protein
MGISAGPGDQQKTAAHLGVGVASCLLTVACCPLAVAGYQLPVGSCRFTVSGPIRASVRNYGATGNR